MDYRSKCKRSIKFLEGNIKENLDYLGYGDDGDNFLDTTPKALYMNK